MPWQSKAQAAWGHSPTGLAALGGAAKVAEWDQASKGKKLPAKVGNGKSRIAHALAKGPILRKHKVVD